MFEVFLVSIAISCIQLEGTYIRFLAFYQDMSYKDIQKLWERLIPIGFAMMMIYMGLFYTFGIKAAPYKGALMLGWIPYQILLMAHLRGRWLEHLFVLSMSVLWSFILHNFSNIVVAIFMTELHDSFVIVVHALLFSLWFLVTLPLSRSCFTNLLPAFAFLRSRGLKIYTALLPFFMVAGFLLMIADSQLWHTWEERLSRLLLPIAFFLCYHYLLKGARRVYSQRRLEHNSSLMEQEASYLEEGRRMAESSLRETRAQKQELLATYRELRQLIEADKLQEAQALIARQDEKLSASAITPYTEFPIINAAISIYLKRAAENGVRVKQKVNLPKRMSTNENELAVLLSNLLENALLACLKENGQREISLILQYRDEQCVLEITNTSSAPLRFAEDGLPMSSREGHGLGMMSLRNFLAKYDGYADFSQKQGIVKLAMYWEDKP